MSVAVVALYAALNALIALVLAFNVVRLRGKTRTDLGTGGHPELERAIRAHGNLIENVPLILILLLILALGGTGRLYLHALGGALTIGRMLHAWGLLTASGASFGRGAGIGLTWLVLLVEIILALMQGLAAL
jgi:uncharacterized protein